MSWRTEHHTGSAATFHARPLPPDPVRARWWFHVDRPALVLGSTQPDAVVDRAAADAAGVEVVRRRSGGGAVLVAPGDVTWLDVIVPASDRLWDADVGRAFGWLGRVWADALGDLGLDAEVHVGALCTTPWSRLVCFAGLGPGEVTIDGRKVVGIAQRRTRDGARFQCAVPHRWAPAELAPLLLLDPDDRARLVDDTGDAVRPLGIAPAVLRAAVHSRFPG